MVTSLLDKLGVAPQRYQQGSHAVHTCIGGSRIATVQLQSGAGFYPVPLFESPG